MSDITIAILGGLGGMIGWGLADFFAKKTMGTIGDVATLFWGQFFGIFPLLLYLFIRPQANIHGYDLLILIILGVWSGLSYLPLYIAFGKGKVSIISPIFASWGVWVSLISAIFLGEIIPSLRWVAFVVVFIGLVLINGSPSQIWKLVTQGKRYENVQGLKEVIFATFLFTFWLIALDIFINGKNWVPLLLIIRIFSVIALLFYSQYKKISLKFENTGIWKYLILIGICDVGGFSAVSLGYSASTHVSIVSMLAGGFSLPTIILARAFLKEKVTRLQLIGALSIVFGIMLIYIL